MVTRLTGLSLALLLALAAGAPAEERYNPANYKPRPVPGATHYPAERFLPPGRDWERIEIHVPQAPPDGKLPTVMLLYGGGWGGKTAGGLHPIARELVARGYVVAIPDYALGATQPVPLVIWDTAAAVRYLRANADKYRVDPERIALWGSSAGGWNAQYFGPSDSATVVNLADRDAKNRIAHYPLPMLEPHPAHAEVPIRVQALVTDWGAGRLDESGKKVRQADGSSWLSADDPPLFTCHNKPGELPNGVKAYLAGGAPAEVVTLDVRNTHVPGGETPGTDAAGQATTWHDSIYAFLDRTLQHPTQATPPEFLPGPGPIHAPATVRLLTVHPAAKLYYTLDGTAPTERSTLFSGPFQVQPGTTVQAIAVVDRLKPSVAARAAYPATKTPPPAIRNAPTSARAKVGEPFTLRLHADSQGPVTWTVAGKLSTSSEKTNPPRPVNWLSIDAATGTLSGTPPAPGVCPVIVCARVDDGPQVLLDAVELVITVEGSPASQPAATAPGAAPAR